MTTSACFSYCVCLLTYLYNLNDSKYRRKRYVGDSVECRAIATSYTNVHCGGPWCSLLQRQRMLSPLADSQRATAELCDNQSFN